MTWPQIDISTFTLFTNMSDPEKARDGTTATWAYYPTYGITGFCGVVFPIPHILDSSQIDPGTYGFDGYNNIKNITIELYGKKNWVPANSTDGVLLGSLSFTGGNGVTRIITPNDTKTAFKSVWFRVTTDGGGVSVIGEMRFYGIELPTGESAIFPSDGFGHM